MNKLNRNILLPLILFALSISFAGCTDSSSAAQIQNGKTSERIISLAPSVTETLFAIGVGDRVVGVTLFCNWPPEVKKLPKVGEFARFDLEKILALKADMVIATKDAPRETIKHELAQYGIELILVGPQTVRETIKGILDVGRAVGADLKAEILARDMEQKLIALQQRVKDSPKVKTVIVFEREPLILAGPDTFADDIIRLAGGTNIASDARIRYPRYSFERLVVRGPEVIIEAAHAGGYGDITAKHIRSFWKKWPSIPAVKNNRIAIVDADLVSRPGPRIIDGLEAVARALHPRLFPFAEGAR